MSEEKRVYMTCTPQGIMTVHVDESSESAVFFHGPAQYYNGELQGLTMSGRHARYLRMVEALGGETDEERNEREACYKV